MQRPSLQELRDQTVQDMEARVLSGGRLSLLSRSVLRILAVVLAGALHMVYGWLSWMIDQLFPTHAELKYLARWAKVFDLPRIPPQFALGPARFTGDDDAEVTEFTEVQGPDGQIYIVRQTAVISDGEAVTNIEAVETGPESNLPPGTIVQLLEPLAGVDAEAEVIDGSPGLRNGVIGGADDEHAEAWRARILQRMQQPPDGGGPADYERWALSAVGSGISHARVYPRMMGPSTVGVRLLSEGTEAGPIPTTDQVDQVRGYIETVRPVTAEVIVFAPEAQAIDFTIALEPNTPEVRAAVEARLEDLVRRVRTQQTGVPRLLLSRIRTEIGISAGVEDKALISPAANLSFPAGVVPVMGTITWLSLGDV